MVAGPNLRRALRRAVGVADRMPSQCRSYTNSFPSVNGARRKIGGRGGGAENRKRRLVLASAFGSAVFTKTAIRRPAPRPFGAAEAGDAGLCGADGERPRFGALACAASASTIRACTVARIASLTCTYRADTAARSGIVAASSWALRSISAIGCRIRRSAVA